MSKRFEGQLTTLFPKMRIWALALTRSRAAADDLTQDVALKVLAAQDSFTPGTNFSAWVHRIMVNHFISSIRKYREFTGTEMMPEIAINAAHEDRTALRELSWALERLPEDQRNALSRIVINEESYEDVSIETGQAIGTLKSRIHRARVHLRSYMAGEQSSHVA
ncbi:MAG: sigma-70 family RNA polymerase sigma factor [Acetobacteraceae bacterium]